MADLAQLAIDTQALTDAVAKLPAPGTSILTPADQATIDTSDAQVQAATAAVTAFATPAPAA